MSGGLAYGLFSMNSYACSRPETAVRVARLAEETGFDTVWAGEHVVLPDPRVPPSPMDPGERILDPLVALTFLAAHTATIRLATGIVILPQRNPLVLAKQVASLDALSRGRVILGIGAGYLEPEMTAVGVPMAERGARTDEYLAAMRSVWYSDRPAFEGRFVRFSGIAAHPRPGPVPIVMGGHSPPAYRRAVQQAHGWYGFALDPEQVAASMAGLREAAARYQRPPSLGRLEISVTPRRNPDHEQAARLAGLGVDRLVLMPPRHLDQAGLVEFVTKAGETLVGR
jgi:probable F420-dependent oxidoreductase